jgi:hypothetical protein
VHSAYRGAKTRVTICIYVLVLHTYAYIGCFTFSPSSRGIKSNITKYNLEFFYMKITETDDRETSVADPASGRINVIYHQSMQ